MITFIFMLSNHKCSRLLQRA